MADLVESTLGEEKGKWFATAKDLGSLDLALELATKYPCDPKTLNRATRDFLKTDPKFALGVSLAGLKWIAHRCGYDLTGIDELNTVSQGLWLGKPWVRRSPLRLRCGTL